MTDHDAVRTVVLDHVESWFEGDAGRMEGILHPSYGALEQLTAEDLIEATANGSGRVEDAADREIAIDISYLNGDTARVSCLSHRYAEIHQLVRTPEGWKILNSTCRSRASVLDDLALPATEELGDPVRCKSTQTWSLRRRPGHGGRRWRRRR